MITQQELIEQKSYYDSIIEKLSQEISSDRSVFETDKIRKNAERFLDFTSDPIWLLVIRADYIHGTLTVYLKGVEKGFTTSFTATGRGDSYRVITGNTVRTQGIIPGTMQVPKNWFHHDVNDKSIKKSAPDTFQVHFVLICRLFCFLFVAGYLAPTL